MRKEKKKENTHKNYPVTLQLLNGAKWHFCFSCWHLKVVLTKLTWEEGLIVEWYRQPFL